MGVYEKIAKYFEKGIYKERHLLTFVEKGVLTHEEYKIIVGSGG